MNKSNHAYAGNKMQFMNLQKPLQKSRYRYSHESVRNSSANSTRKKIDIWARCPQIEYLSVDKFERRIRYKKKLSCQ